MGIQADGRARAMKLLPQTLGLFCVAYLTLGSFSEAQKGEQSHRDIDVEAACDTVFARQKSEKVAKTTPFAMLMEQGSLSHDCEIIAVFATNLPNWQAPDRSPEYLARRTYFRAGSPLRHQLASGDECNGFGDVMAALVEFRAPAIDVPGLKPPPDSMIIVADGSTFKFWSDHLFNGDRRIDHGEISIDAANNGALAALSSEFENALHACWRDVETTVPE